MQDPQPWAGPNRPIPGEEADPDPKIDSDDAMDSVIYRQGRDFGQKGGEADGQGFESSDTSDYGTDSSVVTQDRIDSDGIDEADTDQDRE